MVKEVEGSEVEWKGVRYLERVVSKVAIPFLVFCLGILLTLPPEKVNDLKNSKILDSFYFYTLYPLLLVWASFLFSTLESDDAQKRPVQPSVLNAIRLGTAIGASVISPIAIGWLCRHAELINERLRVFQTLAGSLAICAICYSIWDSLGSVCRGLKSFWRSLKNFWGKEQKS